MMNKSIFQKILVEYEKSSSVFLCNGSSTFSEYWNSGFNGDKIISAAALFLDKLDETAYKEYHIGFIQTGLSHIFIISCRHEPNELIKKIRIDFLNWLIENNISW